MKQLHTSCEDGYLDLMEGLLADPVQSAAAGVWVLQMAQLPHHLLGDRLWSGLPHPERQWIHRAGLSSVWHSFMDTEWQREACWNSKVI